MAVCNSRIWRQSTAHIPWATYTDPETAQVGLTEAQAKEKFGDKATVLRWDLKENDRAMAEGATDGLVKVMLNGSRIIGASIAAKNAGELIQLWAFAIANKQKIGAVAAYVAPYPTVGEAGKRAAGQFYVPKAAGVAAVAIREYDDREDKRDNSITNTKLLQSAEVASIVVRHDAYREPVFSTGQGSDMVDTVFLDDEGLMEKILEGFYILFSRPSDDMIRVIGTPQSVMEVLNSAVEITIHKNQLRKAMLSFGGRVTLLSLLISLVTAAAVYFSLARLLVRPTRALINNMVSFREAPERAAIINPEDSRTEIGEAQRELAAMQIELRAALNQKTRLAGLGEGVAKINHDLRNMLTSAQLLADRLERSDDPLVVRTAPKLLRSLDRATNLCQQTLDFGSAAEPDPVRRRVPLQMLFEEVRESIVPEGAAGLEIISDVDPNVYAEADPDQLFRILQNIARNAAQAMSVSNKGNRIELSARRVDDGVEINVKDDGPGMPTSARQNLFKAFKGGARRGGSGLGLHISRELVRGHHGDIELVDSTTEGTWFQIKLPDTCDEK